MRVTPKWLAIPVTLCDIGKGALAVCWLNWLGWKVELKLPSGLPL
jgi:glycerol-3-phosphate acyltransferase PlsY